MIEAIEVKGFKRFRHQHFEFAPLTVLSGLNGSGKTTLIQALLLTQAAKNSGHSTCTLNGPFGLELGTSEDVLNWEAQGSIFVTIHHQSEDSAEWRFDIPSDKSMYLEVNLPPRCEADKVLDSPRGFSYLGPERFGPRSFSATSALPSSQMEVGVNGEYCAHVLSELGDEVIEHSTRTHPLPSSVSSHLLKYEVEKWLSEIARPIEIVGFLQESSITAELRYREPGSVNWVRSTNMGFGVTYSLPIILSGLIAKEKGLLIVENPEAHLHPAGQSRMGVFLAWLAGKGVQVLVETHSDHIINGIRRAIAEFKYLDNSLALVHWFGELEKRGGPERKGMLAQFIEEIESPEKAYVIPEKCGETEGVRTLKIGEIGSMSDWPKGFFDQYQIDIASLGKIRRSRR